MAQEFVEKMVWFGDDTKAVWLSGRRSEIAQDLLMCFHDELKKREQNEIEG